MRFHLKQDPSDGMSIAVDLTRDRSILACSINNGALHPSTQIMSHPYYPPRSPQSPVPYALRLRRTTRACFNCRKMKIKCRPPDETARTPCERCIRRGLVCEYISVTEREEEFASDEHAAPATSYGSRRGDRSAPPLPYTGPPPIGQRPRFAEQPLPDLSLPTAAAPPPPGEIMYSQYSGSPHPGWTGTVPWPSPPSSAGATQSNYAYPSAHDPSRLALAPPLEMNQGYYSMNVPVPQDPFNPTAGQPPATNNPTSYVAVQHVDPAFITGPSWPQDSNATVNLKRSRVSILLPFLAPSVLSYSVDKFSAHISIPKPP
ncbi:hypothetical protein FB451DRAFT_1478841 [Mycena latifolia]|nr:hypothetical protein FB451DRAFT_1478841 [Mycena latifolia]